MEINETRRRLIDIIANHQAFQPSQKLPIGELSERAGISRQAFNRYYNDLKDYASGAKPIGDLITDTASSRTKELINQNQASLKTLQQQMSVLDNLHQKDVKKQLDSYVTSLMMNDLTMHGANDLRVTLEKQTLYNLELKKQLSHLEIELARSKEASFSSSDATNQLDTDVGEKIKVDTDLSKAFEVFAREASADAFEDAKDLAISRTLKTVNKLAVDKQCNIIIYAERYLSRFSIFFENYRPENKSLSIIVRLPLFDRAELKAFLSKLPPARSLSVHIPHSQSQSELNAQRVFYFGGIPKVEFDGADNSDPVLMNLGFDKVIHYRIRQGE